MQWQINISDTPTNTESPITGYQITDAGVKRGPFFYKVKDVIKALSQTEPTLLEADDYRAEEKSTPPLPFGTIRYSATETGNRQRITMVIPKNTWEIRYQEDETIYSVGFPKLIIQYLLVGQIESSCRMVETRLYAIADSTKPITDDTQLYKFPYTNVGKTNGIVCWGQNERMNLDSLTELERAFLRFISAPFNEDHGVATSLGLPSFKQLLPVIQDKPFEDDWLMPHTQKFGDLFNC